MISYFTYVCISALCVLHCHQSYVTADSTLDEFRSELGRNMNLYHKVYLRRNIIRNRAADSAPNTPKLFNSEPQPAGRELRPHFDRQYDKVKKESHVFDPSSQSNDAVSERDSSDVAVKVVMDPEPILDTKTFTVDGNQIFDPSRQNVDDVEIDAAESVKKIVVITDAMQQKYIDQLQQKSEPVVDPLLVGRRSDVQENDFSDASNIKVVIQDDNIIRESDDPIFNPQRQRETDIAPDTDASDTVIKIVINKPDPQSGTDRQQFDPEKVVDQILVGRQVEYDVPKGTRKEKRNDNTLDTDASEIAVKVFVSDDQSTPDISSSQYKRRRDVQENDVSDASDIKVVIQDDKIIRENDGPIFNQVHKRETDNVPISDASDIKVVIQDDKIIRETETPIFNPRFRRETNNVPTSDVSDIKVVIQDDKIISERDDPIFNPHSQTETDIATDIVNNPVIKIVISDEIQQLQTDTLQPVVDPIFVERQVKYDVPKGTQKYKRNDNTFDTDASEIAVKVFTSDDQLTPDISSSQYKRRSDVQENDVSDASDIKVVIQDDKIIRENDGPILSPQSRREMDNTPDVDASDIKVVIQGDKIIRESDGPIFNPRNVREFDNTPDIDASDEVIKIVINTEDTNVKRDINAENDASDIKVVIQDDEIIRETNGPIFNPQRQREADIANDTDVSDSVIKIVITDKNQQLQADKLQPIPEKVVDQILVGRQVEYDVPKGTRKEKRNDNTLDTDASEIAVKVFVSDDQSTPDISSSQYKRRSDVQENDVSDASDIKVVIQDDKIIRENDGPILSPQSRREMDNTPDIDASDIKVVIQDDNIIRESDGPIFNPRSLREFDNTPDIDASDEVIKIVINTEDTNIKRDINAENDASDIKVVIQDDKIIRENGGPILNPVHKRETDNVPINDASDIKVVIQDDKIIRETETPIFNPRFRRETENVQASDVSDIKVVIQDDKIIRESDEPLFNPRRESEDDAEIDAANTVIKIVINTDAMQLHNTVDQLRPIYPIDELQKKPEPVVDPILVGRQLKTKDKKIIKETDGQIFNPLNKRETDNVPISDASDIKVVIQDDKIIRETETPIFNPRFRRETENVQASDVSDIKVIIPDEKIIRESDGPLFNPRRESEDDAEIDAANAVIKIVINTDAMQLHNTVDQLRPISPIDELQKNPEPVVDPILVGRRDTNNVPASDVSDIKVVIQDDKVISERDEPLFDPQNKRETDITHDTDVSDSVIKIVITDKKEKRNDNTLDTDASEIAVKVFVSDDQSTPDISSSQYKRRNEVQENDVSSIKVFVDDQNIKIDNDADTPSLFNADNGVQVADSDIKVVITDEKLTSGNVVRDKDTSSADKVVIRSIEKGLSYNDLSVYENAHKEINADSMGTTENIVDGEFRDNKWFDYIDSLRTNPESDLVKYYRNWHMVPSLLSNKSREYFTGHFQPLPLKKAIQKVGSSDSFINTFWPFKYDTVKKNLLIALYGVKGTLIQDNVKTNFYRSLYEAYAIPVPVMEEKIILSYDDPKLVKFLNRSNLFIGSDAYIEKQDYKYTIEEKTIIENKINSALKLIYQTSPELYKSISELITCIGVYRSEESQRIGGSSSAVPGVIYLNARPLDQDWPVPYYAEQIVHEFIHNMLYMEEFVIGMYQDYKLLPKVKVVSSIRGVPRNYDLSLHAAYVSTGLVTFTSRIGYYERAESLAAPLRESVDALMEADREHHIMSLPGEAILQHMADMVTLMRI